MQWIFQRVTRILCLPYGSNQKGTGVLQIAFVIVCSTAHC